MSSWLASSFINDFGVSADKLHVVGAGMNIKELPALPERDFSELDSYLWERNSPERVENSC